VERWEQVSKNSRDDVISGIVYQQQVNTTLLAYLNCWQTAGVGHSRGLADV
jgi:hypothetical protein